MNKTTQQKIKLSDPTSILAHQLKHPLSIVKSYIDVLLRGDLGDVNEKQKEYLRDVLTNLDQMTTVVSSMLEISKIEENTYELQLKPTNIIELVKKTIDAHKLWANACGGEIIFSGDDTIPLVQTDPAKIGQVIENFIANAVRYGLPGNRKIEIKLQKDANNVIFSCTDHGIGIHTEDAKKIFSKFYRSDAALNIYPTGSGFGLYINKIIVEKSGGKIWFTSDATAGTTFYFSLPIAHEE